MKVNAGIANWNRYNNETNPRDPRMAEVWLAPLLGWLSRQPSVHSQARVLDFGSGYFSLGAALAPKVARVDGFDINPEGHARARELYALNDDQTQLYTRRAEVPAATYDMVIVNSVLQYLPDSASVEETLKFLSERVQWAPGAFILLIDIVPARYSPAVDALENLLVAIRHKVGWPMFKHLRRCLFAGSDQVLLRLTPAEIETFARKLGLQARYLASNLTPSRRRYSVILSQSRVTL